GDRVRAPHRGGAPDVSARPSKLALSLAALLAVFALAVFAWPPAGPIALGGLLTLALLMALDGLAARRLPPLRARREVPPAMALGERYPIELALEGARDERVVVFDRPPAEWLTG